MSKKYIDANEINYTMASVYWGKDKGKDVYRRTFVAFRSDIDELPTADVAEVVRCKDCKYWIPDEIGRRYCELIDCWTGDRDFCSRGERREENE